MPTADELTGLAEEIAWDQPEGTELSNTPEDTEDAPVLDLPVPPPGNAPAPPSSPEPDIPHETPDQRIQALEQEKQEMSVRFELDRLSSEALQRRDFMVQNNGMSVANANESAKNWLTAKQQEVLGGYEAITSRARDKELYAHKLSTLTGTPIAELLRYDDPDSMRAHATNKSSSSAEVTALKNRISQLEKGQQAPVQRFDSGGGAGSTPTLERKVRDFALKGGVAPTRDEYEAWKASR